MNLLKILVLLMFASTAFAQATSAPSPSGPLDPARFDQIKARRLQEIQNRIAKMHEVQSCVQGATNVDQLRVCMPRRERGFGRAEGQGPAQ